MPEIFKFEVLIKQKEQDRRKKNTEIISQTVIILNYPLTCHKHHEKS